jgi:hypothetical protein
METLEQMLCQMWHWNAETLTNCDQEIGEWWHNVWCEGADKNMRSEAMSRALHAPTVGAVDAMHRAVRQRNADPKAWGEQAPKVRWQEMRNAPRIAGVPE